MTFRNYMYTNEQIVASKSEERGERSIHRQTEDVSVQSGVGAPSKSHVPFQGVVRTGQMAHVNVGVWFRYCANGM